MRLFFLFVFSFFLSVGYAQTEVLLRVCGKDIPKSDFEHYWKTLPSSDRSMGKEYCFEQYVFEQLKIADGLNNDWDKMPAFILQCRADAGGRLEDMFVSRLAKDTLSLLERNLKKFADGEWVKLNVITIPLLQNANSAVERLALARMDSIYHELGNGASFTEKATGQAQWVPMYKLLQEVAGQVSALSVGSYTTPFVSPEGVHIVKLEDRRMEPDAQQLTLFAKSCVENEDWMRYSGLLKGQEKNGENSWCEIAVYDDLLQSVKDSLLVSYWNARHGEPGENKVDSILLEKYFKENKQRYKWTLPHFKGAVVHCANKEDASRIKKKMKKNPPQRWPEEVKNWNRINPKSLVEVKTGLFRIGENPYVDKLAFKCGSLPEHSGYVFVYGKRLKNGPENYLDVYDKVEKDYLMSEKRTLIDSLKSRLGAEIDLNVLKTVNCSGYK